MKSATTKSIHLLIVDNKLEKILYHTRREDGLISLAGGKLENGESLLDGLIREVKEEYNIDLSPYKKKIKILGKSLSNRGEHYLALLKLPDEVIYNWFLFDLKHQEEEIEMVIYDTIENFKSEKSNMHPLLRKQLKDLSNEIKSELGFEIL